MGHDDPQGVLLDVQDIVDEADQAFAIAVCDPDQPARLVVADPPYGKGLGEKALHAAHAGGWLATGALVLLEERIDAEIVVDPVFKPLESRMFGDSRIEFYRYQPG